MCEDIGLCDFRGELALVDQDRPDGYSFGNIQFADFIVDLIDHFGCDLVSEFYFAEIDRLAALD